MIVAGLDSALRKSGAAILDGDRFVHAEAFTASGDTQAQCFTQFRQWWRPFLRAHGVEYVAIEQPLRSDMQRTVKQFIKGQMVTTKVPMTNMETLTGLYGARGHAIQVCDELNIPFVEVNNQDWRQMIYGVRKAPKGTENTSAWWKEQALARCKQMGWDVPSKDAAEGALIAEWLRIKLSPLGRGGDLFEAAE